MLLRFNLFAHPFFFFLFSFFLTRRHHAVHHDESPRDFDERPTFRTCAKCANSSPHSRKCLRCLFIYLFLFPFLSYLFVYFSFPFICFVFPFLLFSPPLLFDHLYLVETAHDEPTTTTAVWPPCALNKQQPHHRLLRRHLHLHQDRHATQGFDR